MVLRGFIVGVIEQILQMPFAYAWLPCLAFFVVAGGLYLMSRPAHHMAAEPAAEAHTMAALAPKKKEQRESARRHGNPIEVHIGSPDDKKTPAIASLIDRSMGGMRLALFHDIEVGTILSIRPIQVNEMVPWVEVEVRSSKPSTEMPEQFEIGCQYRKSPPYSIQLLFG